MANKEYAVFGLGKFGRSIAQTLAASGCEVLAVDIDEDKIQDIVDEVTYAVRADVTDPDALQALGIGNLDGAVIAIAENLEASVMATILVKEMGVPYVLAKATNDIHAMVLKKVGADSIIFPEKEMGVRMAKNMISGNFIDLIELSSNFSIVETEIPQNWVNKTLKELNIRDKYNINVIGVKKGDKVDVNLDPNQPLESSYFLILVGNNSDLERIKKGK